MSVQYPPTSTIVDPQPQHDGDAHVARPIPRRWLTYLRVAWLATTLLCIGLFVVSVPAEYRRLISFANWRPDQRDAVRTGLTQLGLSIEGYAVYMAAFAVISTAGFVAVGAVIFWRRSDERMALFCSLALVTFGVIWPNTLGALDTLHPLLGTVVRRLEDVGIISFFALFYLFPDGRFVPRWMGLFLIVQVVWYLSETYFPNTPFHSEQWPPLLQLAPLVGLFGAMVYAQFYRYRRRSSPVQRHQTKWVVFGFTAMIGGFVGATVPAVINPELTQAGAPGALYAVISTPVYTFSSLLLPVTIAIAVLRYRLWDIDPILNRTLVYGTLTAGVIGIYVLVVGTLGALFRSGSNLAISLIATGVVAVLFQPLRAWLQRGVNRLMYGRRDEPYAVLAHLGKQIQGVLVPDAVLPTIVQTVREVLRLPYVAIELLHDDESSVAATAGVPTGDVLRLPLIYQHVSIGTLLLAQRSPGEPFGPAEMRLLTDLAHQIAVAAHAVRLTTDLQRSRERLVLAREEERRRLRRDLHDDLAPTLAGLALSAGTAANLTHTDPDTARTLMLDLRAAIRAAVGDIRRLVYDLRPPTLDEFGLVAAIRERAAPQQSGGMAGAAPNGDDLEVIVEAPERLPPLSAAVEVAAYRIVQEALMNVRRHAGARVCHIGLALDDRGLHITVLDDGVGLPAAYQPGVGLRSTQERAAELGGTCAIERVAEGGTCVAVFLPVSKGV